jgi:hypothetical protein
VPRRCAAPFGRLEPVEADQRTGQQHEREPPLRIPVPPQPKPPPAAQPRQRPLDLPTVAPKPSRGLDPTPRDPRGDPTPPQVRPVGAAVVALVSVDRVRPGAALTRGRADRRDIVDDRRKHGGVGDVGGGHHRGKRQPAPVADQVQLAPRLATIDWICANVVPRAWRARSWCPRWPATSPADPARRAGPRPPGGAGRTRPRSPTRPGGASTSPASHSQARRRAAAATGSRSGPCTRSRRSRPGRGWHGAGPRTAGAVGPAARAPPAPIARPAPGRQQGLSWRGIMPEQSKGTKRRLIEVFIS